MVADTFLSVNAPMQHALPGWLASCPDIQRQILGRVRANVAAVRAAGVARLEVEAGWSAVLRVSASAEMLLAEQGVIVHPGSFYGMGERNRVVVSLLTPDEQFRLGLQRLREAVF